MPIITIITQDETATIEVEAGENLRMTLLQHGFSPYTQLTRIANCGGRGLCATCGVWIDTGEPQPKHWHDKLALQFGYPRLSCQVIIQQNMTVRILDDKIIWGGRDKTRAGQLQE